MIEMESSLNVERKRVIPLVITSLICLVLCAISFNLGVILSLTSINSMYWISPVVNHTSQFYVESKIPKLQPQIPAPPAPASLPRFAYFISGTRGDLEKLWRTLQSLYHPWNYYVVHLELGSTLEERLELASRIDKDPIFNKVQNVLMITKANMVTYRGPTMVSNTLHACAILLKTYKHWDWFINLSASDYPLVTQDDLLHVFSGLDRELNFIEHTSRLGWKEAVRAMPLYVDPGLYEDTKSQLFRVFPERQLPTAFKLFTGSAWTILSRPFSEYLIWGWDNLPRTLLMYYSNFVSSSEGYFQTVICNSPEFVSTVVNSDLHYISWDYPANQHPHILNINDTAKMIASDAPFARKFKHNDIVLDKIDAELLGRENGSFTPGGWCSGNPPCSEVGNPTKLIPGPGAERLTRLLARLVYSAEFTEKQCMK
ncbi:OLC1v1023069C1 [Oldenlandia corymbosa var. corymbosa]|uniref:OLC1v1023069C1 n=1 Tax=Oldenlandia corymbosa var. corymbosa TaxID=529605 RepID=A0AAV1BZ52_OLDCO|nr:OLC1v1023069C1 [Oldenlandia corymbosa var. corymbosa]